MQSSWGFVSFGTGLYFTPTNQFNSRTQRWKWNLSLGCCWVSRSTALVVQSTAWAPAVPSQAKETDTDHNEYVSVTHWLLLFVCVCVCVDGCVCACCWQLWMDMPEIAHCRILFFLSLLRLKNNSETIPPYNRFGPVCMGMVACSFFI